MLGADWRLCERKLKLDRGNFFHTIYRIEQKLGRAFRETQPYGLFPVDEYFHGALRFEARSLPAKVREIRRPAALNFPVPLAKIA